MTPLSPVEQWVFGTCGGALIASAQFLSYAVHLPDDARPPGRYKLWITVLAWASFVVLAGLAAYICEPHSKLLAAYEGASAPALFFLAGHHYSRWMRTTEAAPE